MKKSKIIKVASAKDIYEFLKSKAVNGIAHQSKKDVARHFGYKSSNGDGFLANFKLLEENRLIEDVSTNKRSGVWKVDMDSNFDFSKKYEKRGRNKMSKKNKGNKILSNVHLEMLIPVEDGCRQYIALTNIAGAFDVDKHFVYNAASKTNKLAAPYMKMVVVEEGFPAKKSIELEGLPYLFEKLSKRVSTDVLDATLSYINNTYSMDKTDEEVSTTKEDTVSKVDNTVKTSQTSNKKTSMKDEKSKKADAKKDAKKAIETKDAKKTIEAKDKTNAKSKLSEVESQQTIFEIPNLDLSSSANLKELLSTLDSITNILSEFNSLKTELAILKTENEELLADSSEYKKIISEKDAEISKLKEELLTSTRATGEILARANVIRQYVNNNSFANKH